MRYRAYFTKHIKMEKIYLLWNTVKYLKFKQIYYRLKYKILKPKYYSSNSKIVLRKKNNEIELFRFLDQSYLGDNRFHFLNITQTISSWNDDGMSKLWLYNLHYFDCLNAVGAENLYEKHLMLMRAWKEENPPMVGNGWEPYPLSLRIVNWVKFFINNKLEDEALLKSLYSQVLTLSHRLEYHILGNHLFANIKALIFGTLFFNTDEMNKILNKATILLLDELDEQILVDGGNFERTPMYHNIMLVDLLDLVWLLKTYSLENFKQIEFTLIKKAKEMLQWTETMTFPNGEFGLFNDAALGISATRDELIKYFDLLEVDYNFSHKNLGVLKQSGYVRVNKGFYFGILNVGSVGPKYLPGHAHANSLSFELCYKRNRIFVNGGTSVYGNGQERLLQRKTESHNTVLVNNVDSSEVWSGFRVARRANVIDFFTREESDEILVSAKHDGYKRLKNPVEHKRSWIFKDESFVIEDCLNGDFEEAKAIFVLHPNIGLQVLDDSEVELKLNENLSFRLSFENAKNFRVIKGKWNPRFGVSLEVDKIEVIFNGSVLKSILTRSLN